MAASREQMALEQLSQEATCPVCRDFFKEPMVLSCGHNFCFKCLAQLGTRFSCPQCRARVEFHSAYPNCPLDFITYHLKRLRLSEEAHQESSGHTARQAPAPQNPASEGSAKREKEAKSPMVASREQTVFEQLGQEAICLLCLDFLEQPMVLFCGHNFCRDCLAQLGTEYSCLDCRARVGFRGAYPNWPLGNIIGYLKRLRLSEGAHQESSGHWLCREHGEISHFREDCHLYLSEQVQVMLNDSTAHPRLHCDTWKVTSSRGYQECPDVLERFDQEFCVLGCEGFTTGRHWWEVQLDGQLGAPMSSAAACWAIGVAKESVRRKGRFRLTPQEGIWAMGRNVEGEMVAFSDLEKQLRLRRPMWSLCVRLDYAAEKVEFLDAETEASLYTFRTGPLHGEMLRPFFYLGQQKLTIYTGHSGVSADDSVQEAPGAEPLSPDQVVSCSTVHVRLDDSTAHPWLRCITWRVTWAIRYQECPDMPERFDQEYCVLGCEGFTTGSHLWEVQLDEQPGVPMWSAAACWAIGVAKESVRRKGSFELTPQEGIWAVGRNLEGEMVAFSDLEKQLRLRRPLCALWVKLEYEAEKVEFVDAETEASLYTFRTGPLSGEKLRPFFYLGQQKLAIRTGHGGLSANDSVQEAPAAVNVTLNASTAHPRLRCGTWRVTWASRYQECPDVLERFDREFCVLGCEGFTTGSHLWEVQLDEQPGASMLSSAARWAIGVAKESVRRKGRFELTPQEGIWAVGRNVEGEIVAFSDLEKRLRLGKPLCNLCVKLDYEAEKVEFLDAEADIFLYTFRTGPLAGETVRPFFYLGQQKLTLCTGHSGLSADDSDQEAPGAGPLSPDQVLNCDRVHVMLDKSTAHPWLRCGTWSMTWGSGYQDCPYVSERFDREFCVLGCEGFTTGSHWWEVQLDGQLSAPMWSAAACWAIGVAKESVPRKGKFELNPQEGIWAVGRNVEGEIVAFSDLEKQLRLRRPLCSLCVRLDYEAEKVEFVDAETEASLYTFRTGPLSRETLRPFFYLGQQKLTLCTGHPAHLGLSADNSHQEAPGAGPLSPDQVLSCDTVHVTLDGSTAHPWLHCGTWRVTWASRYQECSDVPERFDREFCVLGCEGFTTGSHLWEVQVDEQTYHRVWDAAAGWAIGVAKESVRRKGGFRLNPQYGIWAMGRNVKGEMVGFSNREVQLRLGSPLLGLCVRLDYEAEEVEFLDAKRGISLYTFRTGLLRGEKLRPFFYLGKEKLTICTGHPAHLGLPADNSDQEAPGAVDIMLDDSTAHPWLQCDTWKVSWAYTFQECPDVPERFDREFCVLGCEGFTTGRHWWEVQVERSYNRLQWPAVACWAIGVARVSVRRKGSFRLSPQEGIWAVGRDVEQENVAFWNIPRKLSWGGLLSRLQVRLDYEAGKVQFLDAETEASLYTFRTGPLHGETLRPFFYLGQEHLTISIGHPAHWD